MTRLCPYLACVALLVGLAAAVNVNEDLYVDKSIPEYEDVLTDDDFARAAFMAEDIPSRSGGAPQYRNDLFEGDIANPELKASSVEKFVSEGATNFDDAQGVMRNAIKNRYQLWPNRIVPYTISSRFNSNSRSRIASAMQDYAQRTCIKFVPRTNQHSDYINIISDNGCYSMVGKTGGRQSLSLGSGCMQKGVIIHELMHAVGFFHEQSRTDRDSYIRINWDNIRRDMHGQFEKYSLNTIQYLGAEYDYASIMHYGAHAFSSNGQPSITPLQAGAQIGQRAGFSPTDVTKINKLYRCDGTGGVTPATTRRPPPSPVTRPPAPGRTTTDAGQCRDVWSDCERRSARNRCRRAFMRRNCAATCDLCDEDVVRRTTAWPTFTRRTRQTRGPFTRRTRQTRGPFTRRTRQTRGPFTRRTRQTRAPFTWRTLRPFTRHTFGTFPTFPTFPEWPTFTDRPWH